MTQIKGLAEAALYVEDLAKSTAFYRDVLGLPASAVFDDAIFFQTGPHATLILFDINKLEKRISVIPGHGARGQGHIALAIPAQDMDAWRKRLQAHNVPIEHEQTWPLGTHSIYFRDPDNNSLELIEDAHYPMIWKRLGQES